MRSVLIALLACYAVRDGARVIEWRSNRSIWSAAERSDPDDPWCLTNAAMETHEPLDRLLSLPVPAWLPEADRQVYVRGYLNHAITLRQAGRVDDSNRVTARAVMLVPSLVHFHYQ